MTKRKKIILFLSITGILLLLALSLILFWGGREFEKEFILKHAYKECDPNALFSDLKEVFDINIPIQAEKIKTARTSGSMDGSNSPFIVRFSAEPNDVTAFLKSFPRQISFDVYKREDDSRNKRALRTPAWFIEPIKEGKIGRVSGYGDLEIYIDTTSKKRFIVYLSGYYERKAEELLKEYNDFK